MNKIKTVEQVVKEGINYSDGKLLIPADIESIVRLDRTTLRDTLLETMETLPYISNEEDDRWIMKDEAKAIISKVCV